MYLINIAMKSRVLWEVGAKGQRELDLISKEAVILE